jgi:hypothetical protein
MKSRRHMGKRKQTVVKGLGDVASADREMGNGKSADVPALHFLPADTRAPCNCMHDTHAQKPGKRENPPGAKSPFASSSSSPPPFPLFLSLSLSLSLSLLPATLHRTSRRRHPCGFHRRVAPISRPKCPLDF